MRYEDLQSSERQKKLFEAQIKTASDLAEIRKLLKELVESKNRKRK